MLWMFSAAEAGEILLTHARLWDGLNPTVTDAQILVRDERIAEVGTGLVAPSATVVDVSGATVIPGLIDSHVHLSLDPGAAWRAESAADHQALLAAHLRAYLACGVTTILDPAVLASEQSKIETLLADGNPGPRYLSLGAPFSPVGGYPAVTVPGFPEVGNAEQVERHFDAVVAQGVVGVKVTIEPGMAGPIWPTYSADVAEAIRNGAQKRNLTVFAHARTPLLQRRAIRDLGARVMVHAPATYDKGFTNEIARGGVVEVSTLDILDAWRMAWTPSLVENAQILATVPKEEIDTARDRSVAEKFRLRMIKTVAPAAPFARWLSHVSFNEAMVARRLASTGRAIFEMHKAGVAILMGSDAGNWPVIPYQFHGPSSIREMELIVAAGLTPEQALVSATRAPARVFRIPVGTIEAGKGADLVVVNGDPTSDISALRHIRFTMRAGEMRSPEGWLRD